MIEGNVYKESDYIKTQKSSDFNSKVASNLGEIKQDFIQFGDALAVFPLRSTLTVIGVVTVVYIGFKIATKFGSIGNELKKKLRS